MEIFKHVTNCFTQLDIFQHTGFVYITNLGPKIDKVLCNMEVREDKIVITYNKYQKFPRSIDAIPRITIQTNKGKLYTDELWLKQYPLPLIYTTNNLSTNIIDKSKIYFIRMMFQLEKKFSLDTYISNCLPSRTESNRYACNLIRITLNKPFDLYTIQAGLDNFLVLDCCEQLTFSEFKQSSHAIITSLGFISGHFINGNRFIFFSKEASFSSHDNIDFIMSNSSINNNFPPILTNPHSLSEIIPEKELASLLNLHRSEKFLFTSTEFSNLCNLALNNAEILGSIFMLLESSTLSLESMGCTLCVALEALGNFISKSNEEKILPIKNKSNWKKLKSDLNKQLSNQYLSKEPGVGIIKNKINNLNSPTNKDKLSKSFELTNITLTSDDIEAISNRNIFLHGKFSKIDIHEIKKDPSLLKLFKTCLKLNFLVSALLLRLSDFNGWMPTYLHLCEKRNKRTVDSLVRFIGSRDLLSS